MMVLRYAKAMLDLISIEEIHAPDGSAGRGPFVTTVDNKALHDLIITSHAGGKIIPWIDGTC